MRHLIVLTILTIAAGGLIAGGATVASADPNLPNITAHRHFLATPSLQAFCKHKASAAMSPRSV